VKRRGDVGEEHERRRRYPNLRRVHDADVFSSRAHRRIGRRLCSATTDKPSTSGNRIDLGFRLRLN
jgi:hypothetical protein